MCVGVSVSLLGLPGLGVPLALGPMALGPGQPLWVLYLGCWCPGCDASVVMATMFQMGK